ncbi:hypothetical protein [Aestuariirhabdus litorea]|uniref:Uncharacterized protein n=1 Tax=Aestuariirhabdus litorea TaxID=2528527 RepID=A0A3P3VP25_9GAMM|nr:hypothetical protein [Aestuariirhabdus litorea]RRJ84360.1 hypothetical protein D0544_04430 [Aestuariirhabdus litorea]RWW97583.1 hypothetical protein DZC74_04425 [Endozoicomonadaceae bacterium GTF-13]
MVGVVFAAAFAGLVGVEAMNNEPAGYSDECRQAAIDVRNEYTQTAGNYYYGHTADDDGWGMKEIAFEAEAAKRACHAEGR